jgi:hypothetical protein
MGLFQGRVDIQQLVDLFLTSPTRSRKYAGNAANLAERRRFKTRAIQWRLRDGHGLYKSKSIGIAWENRSLLSVSTPNNTVQEGCLITRHIYSPEDSEYEVKCMQPGIGELEVFPSIWGRKSIPSLENILAVSLQQ